MKVLGLLLAVGFAAGPLGVTGMSHVLIGIVLAAFAAAVAGGVASALGLAPARDAARGAKRRS